MLDQGTPEAHATHRSGHSWTQTDNLRQVPTFRTDNERGDKQEAEDGLVTENKYVTFRKDHIAQDARCHYSMPSFLIR